MNKYFKINKDCKLYEDYFLYLQSRPKIVDAFKEVCKEFGIETKEFYMTNKSFRIVPTETDRENFSSVMKKN